MLRVKSATGWWLITHRDHAHLAASFAAHWGNDLFLAPEPRSSVLLGICVHDDGWTVLDTHPSITRDGKPSAFSHELVGKYSAFEEINLADYLHVREVALDKIEAENPYAALLVAKHTYNLLTARADRATIAADQLPLLDTFLQRQLRRHEELHTRITENPQFSQADSDLSSIENNFRLLQATDNLSLYSCVDYAKAGNLLHPLPTVGGEMMTVEVLPVAARHFRLKPYPLDEPLLTFTIPTRHVHGDTFESSSELAKRYGRAPEERLQITISR